MTILALAGKRRTGKTEAANIIVSQCQDMGIRVRKVSFADTLREMFSEKTGIATSMLLNPESKEEFRKRLVKFADEERSKDENIFVNSLFSSIYPDENVVIDDMRLLPELVAVIKTGGKPYRIESWKHVRETRNYRYDREIDEHISETDLDLSAHTYECLGGGRIFNNKSKDHLKLDLIEIVKKEFFSITFTAEVS